MSLNLCVTRPGVRPARVGVTKFRLVVVVVVVLLCAAVPVGLVATGMPVESALAVAGAVAAFSLGVTHQVLAMFAWGPMSSGGAGARSWWA